MARTRHRRSMAYPEEVIKRFWSYVQGCDHGVACRDCCWPWRGGKEVKRGNYGRFFPTSRVMIRAQRFMWVITYNAIPTGLWVLHNCPGGDNPSCVNPRHLFLGTNLANVRDRQKKGRGRFVRGETHGRAKLREADVYTIRREAKQLALRYGI